MTRYLSDRKQPQTEVTTYDLDRETLRAAWACSTREEVRGIIRANGKMVSKPALKQLKDIAKGKPKAAGYDRPKVSAVPVPKGCSEGPDYVWQETGMTARSEANWLDPWGR